MSRKSGYTGRTLEAYKDEASVPLSLGCGQQDVGKRVRASKRRFWFQFMFGPSGKPHKLDLLVSVLSGKRTIYLDGTEVYAGTSSGPEFSFTVTIDTHVAKIVASGEDVEASVDFVPFDELRPRDSLGIDEARALEVQAMKDAEARIRASLRNGGGGGLVRKNHHRSSAGSSSEGGSGGPSVPPPELEPPPPPEKKNEEDLLSFEERETNGDDASAAAAYRNHAAAYRKTNHEEVPRKQEGFLDDPFAGVAPAVPGVAPTVAPPRPPAADPFASLVSYVTPQPSEEDGNRPASSSSGGSWYGYQPQPSTPAYGYGYGDAHGNARQQPRQQPRPVRAADASAARAATVFGLFDNTQPDQSAASYY